MSSGAGKLDGAERSTDFAPLDDERLHVLLERTSRTFALAIPLLPQPTLREVTIAYLLFRIADTFEDASVFWSRPHQLAALAGFGRLLEDFDLEQARELTRSWVEPPSSDHAGYLELVAETPRVLAAWDALPPGARRPIAHHTRRTAELMAGFVERSDGSGELRLETLAELRDYCYAVAGIVGEMLTELFILDREPLEAIGDTLRERAALFGEGLQLVNILKDSAFDATEGRSYVPASVDRSAVFALARSDLDAATEYVLAIQQAGGPDGVVAFTAVPVALARATLDKVEADGPGSKISRLQVYALHDRVMRNIRERRPALTAPGATGA